MENQRVTVEEVDHKVDDQVDHENDQEGEVKLERRLSLLDGIMINVGVIIGSGIFISPKGVLAGVESVGATLCIWVAAGVISVFGAMCYAELGTMIPASGGTYTYVRVIFGDFWGFLNFWACTVIAAPIANAVTALMLSMYCLEPFYPDPECPPPKVAIKLFAIAAVMFIMFVNCWSVKLSSRLQNATSLSKLVALGVIITTGMVNLGMGNTENFQKPFTFTNIRGLGTAFYACLFSYSGWQSLNIVIEELKNPSRNLPIAVIVAPTLTTVVNTLTNVAYFTVLSSAELLSSEAVAVSFAEQALGRFSVIIPVSVVLSCVGSLNGCILGSSRQCFAGAREGHLPRFLAMVGIRHKTPILCVIVTSLLTACLCFVDSVFTLINLFSFVNFLFYGLLAVGLLYLRIKEPDRPRPFKVNFIIPVIFALVCTFLTIFAFLGAPVDSIIGVAILLSGIPIYFIRARFNTQVTWMMKLYRHSFVFFQKIIFVTPERHHDA